MENLDIPRSFWHVVSVCLLAATGVFLYIAVNSPTLTIEVANAKINLNRTISETEGLIQHIQLEYDTLAEANQDLQEKYDELAAATRTGGTSLATALHRIDIKKIDTKKYEVVMQQLTVNQEKLKELRRTLE